VPDELAVRAELSVRRMAPTSMSLARRFDALFPIVAMTMLAAACALTPKRLQPQLLPTDVESNPSPYMVVTIKNEPFGTPGEAGSSVRHYSAGEYSVAGAAKSAAKALARDYGLKEASTWPISALHVYCVLFRVTTTEGSTSLIEQLRRDPRVTAVQPLNEFKTQGRVQQASATHGRAGALPRISRHQ
jgi:hypothetical protein